MCYCAKYHQIVVDGCVVLLFSDSDNDYMASHQSTVQRRSQPLEPQCIERHVHTASTRYAPQVADATRPTAIKPLTSMQCACAAVSVAI
jgi:hypothetical protein